MLCTLWYFDTFIKCVMFKSGYLAFFQIFIIFVLRILKVLWPIFLEIWNKLLLTTATLLHYRVLKAISSNCNHKPVNQPLSHPSYSLLFQASVNHYSTVYYSYFKNLNVTYFIWCLIWKANKYILLSPINTSSFFNQYNIRQLRLLT
jgi:hypothetical protein